MTTEMRLVIAMLVYSMCSSGAVYSQDMSDMDHNHANHGQDAGVTAKIPVGNGSVPNEKRDPHAYSGGYDFGMLPLHRTADMEYRSGVIMDRLESVHTRDEIFSEYDLLAWLGKDYDRLVVKAEGEADEGKLHEARTELLWSHALAAHWDTQLGLRYDSGLTPDRKWLALGVQGLAPYWFEIGATVYIGEQGHTALRIGAEYELLLTQRLILHPRAEANFYGKQDAARELGTGLSNLTAGMRLRYEISRELAPYVGVEWQGKYAGTADYAQAAGQSASETRMIAGVRFWY